MVMKHQRKNGSLFNSPATTAAVFQHLKNVDCLDYLQSVLGQFGNAGLFRRFICVFFFFTYTNHILTGQFYKLTVPTVYPLHIYARLCMVDSLERLGIDYHFSEEIRSVLDETYG